MDETDKSFSLSEKLNTYFPGRVVRKDLTQKIGSSLYRVGKQMNPQKLTKKSGGKYNIIWLHNIFEGRAFIRNETYTHNDS